MHIQLINTSLLNLTKMSATYTQVSTLVNYLVIDSENRVLFRGSFTNSCLYAEGRNYVYIVSAVQYRMILMRAYFEARKDVTTNGLMG